VFSSGEDTVCIACRRRGTTCVNQDESEVEPDTKDGATNRRLLRIEAMLETLLERQATDSIASAKMIGGKSPVPVVEMPSRKL
jgi:hypothetical protein